MTSRAMIYILDDDHRVREALVSWLASMGRSAVAFSSAEEFLGFPRPDVPSCLVLDLQMPGMDGLELQERLLSRNPPPIIFLTAHGNVPASVKAMKAGAFEFLTKPFDQNDLLRAIEEAIRADQDARASNEQLRVLKERYELLTPREREVFRHVIQGLQNKQTADQMGLSEIMVRIHRGNVMKKMAASSLAELVVMATRLNLLPPHTKR